MQTDLNRNIFDERITAALTGAFATVATLLAVIGLYGVLAFNVAQRTREIGIRMALGARPNQGRRLVGREMIVLLAAGSFVGVSAAAATGSLIQTYLYEMKACASILQGGVAIGVASLGSGKVAPAANGCG